MSIKESSDELDPPVVTTGVPLGLPAGPLSFKDYLAYAIATCGVGYLPLAPGTWGSLIGIGLHVFWVELTLKIFHIDLISRDRGGLPIEVSLLWTTFTILLVFCLVMAGIWASTRVEKLSGRKDASIVVIDEVAGQVITFLFLPFAVSTNWRILVAGFILFRAFDIWKPFPIRRLESLESGLGVMADDVLAGVYAGTVLLLLLSIYLFLS